MTKEHRADPYVRWFGNQPDEWLGSFLMTAWSHPTLKDNHTAFRFGVEKLVKSILPGILWIRRTIDTISMHRSIQWLATTSFHLQAIPYDTPDDFRFGTRSMVNNWPAIFFCPATPHRCTQHSSPKRHSKRLWSSLQARGTSLCLESRLVFEFCLNSLHHKHNRIAD